MRFGKKIVDIEGSDVYRPEKALAGTFLKRNSAYIPYVDVNTLSAAVNTFNSSVGRIGTTTVEANRAIQDTLELMKRLGGSKEGTTITIQESDSGE